MVAKIGAVRLDGVAIGVDRPDKLESGVAEAEVHAASARVGRKHRILSVSGPTCVAGTGHSSIVLLTADGGTQPSLFGLDADLLQLWSQQLVARVESGPMPKLPYPTPSSPDVSERMRRNRRRDTSAELAVRSELHRRGLRFRVDLRVRLAELSVRPDVVFRRAKLALFIDGCFWHRCPLHGTSPRTNPDYWLPKLNRNVARDREVDTALAAEGWRVLRVWEHENSVAVADRVTEALRAAV